MCVGVCALGPFPREIREHCGCDHTESRAFPVAFLEPSRGEHVHLWEEYFRNEDSHV